MKYSLKKSDKDRIIKDISVCLREKYIDISAAYIFGSFISLETFSDIDLGVIIEMDQSRSLSFELDLEGALERLVKYPVDVRVLNQAPLSFSQNVFRNGRVIIDKNPNLRADFETRILKEYFEIAPFLKRYLQEVLNAPV